MPLAFGFMTAEMYREKTMPLNIPSAVGMSKEKLYILSSNVTFKSRIPVTETAYKPINNIFIARSRGKR